TEKVIAIGSGEFRVERILVHGFREHLGDIALDIIGDAPPQLRLSAKGRVALEEVRHRLHHVHFELYIQCLAIMKYASVMVWQTTGTQVQIESFIEVADLLGLGAILIYFFEHSST